MPEEAASWYVRSRGRVRGPFTEAQLELMRSRGQLAQFDEISQDRRGWAPAGRLHAPFGPAAGADALTRSDSSMQVAAPIQSSEGWHCNTLVGAVGPVSIAHVVGLIQSGQLNGNSFVWKAGLPSWVALRDVPELACHLSSTQLAGNTSGSGGANARNASHARSTRGGARATWFLITTAALAVATAAIVAVALFSNSSSRAFPPASVVDNRRVEALGAQTKADSLSIASPLSQMRGAVGIVVSGFAITDRKTGKPRKMACRTATCFAISNSGHLITNKMLVEDHRNLTRADAKIEEAREKHFLDIKPALWVYIRGEEHEAKPAQVSEKYDFAVIKIDHQGPFFHLESQVENLRGAAISALGYHEKDLRALSIDVASRNPPPNAVDEFASIRDESKSNFHMEPGAVTNPRCTFVETETEYVQYTASIRGPTGGPLILEKNGTVIGINVADALVETREGQRGAEKFYALSLSQAREELARIAPEFGAIAAQPRDGEQPRSQSSE
jgi:hypothetical protein